MRFLTKEPGCFPAKPSAVSICCLNTQAEGFPALHRPPRCCHLSPWEIRVQINMNPPSKRKLQPFAAV